MSVSILKEPPGRADIVVARLTRPDVPAGQSFDLDLLQSVALEAALRELTSPPASKVVLDLAQVAYMDSKTFWALVRAANTLKGSGGRLVVARLHANILRLLSLTGADEYLQAFPSVEEAAAALGAS